MRTITTDKIDTNLDYLNNELTRNRLNPILAKTYLYIMQNAENENEVIYRPKWSFIINDFDNYLRFFKKYNLLHYSGSTTKFTLDEDLRNSFTIDLSIEDEDTINEILKIGKEIPEFKNLYFKEVA